MKSLHFYVIQTREIKSPRFNIRRYLDKRRPYAAAAAAAERKRPVLCLRENASSFQGRRKKGGSIAPQSFTDQLLLFQLENRYSFCSPWILDLPTALIKVLF